MRIANWDDPERFKCGNIEHLVYTGGEGPPIILMHELPGLSVQTIGLATCIRMQGYRVHMPLLVGKPRQMRPRTNALRLCISREIHLFAAAKTSPIVDWLRAYVDKIAPKPEDKVVVIGMCLTGNFALALVAKKSVAGAVVCQPSLPLWPGSKRAVAMSENDWEQVCARASEAPSDPGVLLMRFEQDGISPVQRFDRIVEELDGYVEALVCLGKAHSTLVYDQDPSALEALFVFLQRRLSKAMQCP